MSKILYCSPIWNPALRKNISLLEKIQQRFTKRMAGLQNLSYIERLSQLGALSVENRLVFADLVTAFKAIHGGWASDFGLSLSEASTRSRGIRLLQRRANSKLSSNMFLCRVPSMWNKLPVEILTCSSLPGFKKLLKKHLFLSQVT